MKSLFGWRVLIPRPGPRRLAGRSPACTAPCRSRCRRSPSSRRTPQQIERAVHGLVSGRYRWIKLHLGRAVRASARRYRRRPRRPLVRGVEGRCRRRRPGVAALVEFGVRPDIVPTREQTTSALLEEWPAFDSLTDPINRVFLPRADIATDTLAAGLAELGWEVDDVTAYRTVRAAPPPAATREAIKTGASTPSCSSSSTVRNLVGAMPATDRTTRRSSPASGRRRPKAAEEHGLRVDVLAETATVVSLVEPSPRTATRSARRPPRRATRAGARAGADPRRAAGAYLTVPSPSGSADRTVVHLLRHGEVYNPEKVLYGRLPGCKLSISASRWRSGRPSPWRTTTWCT
ncbi:MAG: uroporphyrinogen-III synthase [Candidatus Nanopelagicales bacterium]